jgi:hypothetical protein
MPAHRRAALVAIACTGLLLTACTSNGDEPEPRPTTATSSGTPTQSPTKPAWESRYTEKELRAYEAALARFTEYEQRSEQIWARGEVTPGAEALFKEYWITWPNTLNTLRVYERDGVKVSGLAKVIWSKQSSIDVRPNSRTVSIRQCVDPSTIKVAVTEGDTERSKVQPYIRTITMDQFGTQPFRISVVVDITSGKKVTRCGP